MFQTKPTGIAEKLITWMCEGLIVYVSEYAYRTEMGSKCVNDIHFLFPHVQQILTIST